MTLERVLLKKKIKINNGNHKKNKRNRKDLKNRSKLRKYINQRVVCEGTIHLYSEIWWTFGHNSENKIRTVLQDIIINSKIKLTHIWVESADLLYFFKYDMIKFNALVLPYRKKDGKLSYGLYDLQNIVKIN